jgi:ribose/xylose/arabinose/galactoside ABC-type transport system permease subunit
MVSAGAAADQEPHRRSAPGFEKPPLLDRVLDAGILLSLIGLIVLFSILSPEFFTFDNLVNILDASAIVGIVAVGVTIALIAGHFDLSVGSIVGLCSTLLAWCLVDLGVPVSAAILLAVMGGLAIGSLNGILIVNFGINSIIATLGMLAAVRGVAFMVAGGQPIPVDNSFLVELGVSRPLGIPVSVYIMAVAYVGAWVLLTQTKLGLHIYAVGGNDTAAERSGIRVNRITRLVFLGTAFCAAIGAILTTARTFSGQAVYGRELELDVLTAVLLGGIGLRGGEGSILRTLIGVGIVGVITNGLVLTQVPAYWTDVARGGALIIAVVLEAIRERRGRR